MSTGATIGAGAVIGGIIGGIRGGGIEGIARGAFVGAGVGLGMSLGGMAAIGLGAPGGSALVGVGVGVGAAAGGLGAHALLDLLPEVEAMPGGFVADQFNYPQATHAENVVIPVVYGLTFCTGNIVATGKRRRTTESVSASPSNTPGQKGGDDSDPIDRQTATGYKVETLMCVCEGEVQGVERMLIKEIDKTDIEGVKWNFHTGTSTQTLDAFLTDATILGRYKFVSGQEPLMRRTAYISQKGVRWPFGALPNFIVELSGRKISFFGATAAFTNNPAHIIYDILTNTQYGVGLADVKLDKESFVDVANWCDEIEDGETKAQFDLQINQQASVQDWIDEILATCGGFLIYSEGKIKIKSYRNEEPTQYFTEANIVAGSFTVAKKRQTNTPNRIKVEYQDREQDYKLAVVSVDDDIDIDATGEKRERSLRMHGIKREFQARRMAQFHLDLARLSRTSCSFRTGLHGIKCEAGDTIAITHSLVGWDEKQFVIQTIAEAENNTGEILCAEKAALSFDTVPRGENPKPKKAYVNHKAPILPLDHVKFVEMPTESAIRVFVARQATEDNDPIGEADDPLYVVLQMSSDGGTSYNDIGLISEFAATGTLVSASVLPSKTLDSNAFIDIENVVGTFMSASDEEWIAGRNQVLIDNEVISFQTATLIGDNTYRLTGLIRGQQHSEPAAHSANARVFLIESTFTIPIDNRMLGKTLYFKPIATNEYGIQTPIELRNVYSVTIQGNGARPLPIYALRINGKQANVTAVPEKSVTFVWNKKTREGFGGFFEAGNEPRGFGADVTEADFLNYRIDIMDSSGTIKRTVEQTSESYNYSEAQNIADFGDFTESINVRITAQGQVGNADAVTKSFKLNVTDGSTDVGQETARTLTMYIPPPSEASATIDAPEEVTAGVTYEIGLTAPGLPVGSSKLNDNTLGTFALVDTPTGMLDQYNYNYNG